MWLEDEQYELLARFVEAHRNAPQDCRGVFIAAQTHNERQATFLHSRVRNLRFEGSMSDAEVLAHTGLLRLSYGARGDAHFSVLPLSIEVYEEKRGSSPPVTTLSAEPQEFISSAEFRGLHAAAFAQWEQAATLLWAADSRQQLTTIGHLCREALQEFAASLAGKNRVDVSGIDPTKTVARLKAVVATCSTKAGATASAFLSELISYWGAVSDLVQRQEHGAQREGEPLVWADARRVVFQTCVVMFEVSRGVR